ncbi:MAG: radical SAM protein [Planctomycetota bacterium]
MSITSKPLPKPYIPAHKAQPEQSDDWQKRDDGYKLWILDLADGPYMDYPMAVHFETLARCNAACDFCPYPTLERKGVRMTDELIDKVIRELNDIPEEIPFQLCPHRVNEPFLDKRIFDYIPRINDELPNADITIATNGSVLNDANLDRIARFRKITYFNVSFNDHRKDEYQRVMQLDYDRTLDNLDRLHERIASGVMDLPVRVSRVGDGSEADADFIKWCSARWPKFGAICGPRENWFGKVVTKTLYSTPPMGCSQWFKIGFLPDGRETYCCFDEEGQHGVGSVADSHILDVYNHPKRRARRKKGLMRADLDMCQGCQVRA